MEVFSYDLLEPFMDKINISFVSVKPVKVQSQEIKP